MDDKDINRLVENLTVFMAAYFLVKQNQIPSYQDGEDAFVQFIQPAVEAYFSKQHEALNNYRFTHVDKPSTGGSTDDHVEDDEDSTILERIRQRGAQKKLKQVFEHAILNRSMAPEKFPVPDDTDKK